MAQVGRTHRKRTLKNSFSNGGSKRGLLGDEGVSSDGKPDTGAEHGRHSLVHIRVDRERPPRGVYGQIGLRVDLQGREADGIFEAKDQEIENVWIELDFSHVNFDRRVLIGVNVNRRQRNVRYMCLQSTRSNETDVSGGIVNIGGDGRGLDQLDIEGQVYGQSD